VRWVMALFIAYRYGHKNLFLRRAGRDNHLGH